jgi:hypothetical protein
MEIALVTISAATWQSMHLPTVSLAAASLGKRLRDLDLCVTWT